MPDDIAARRRAGDSGRLDGSMTPEGASVLLAADRFYGGAALVAWRKKRGWKWRIRLKGNLILRREGGHGGPS
jgi:hypothetical protein